MIVCNLITVKIKPTLLLLLLLSILRRILDTVKWTPPLSVSSLCIDLDQKLLQLYPSGNLFNCNCTSTFQAIWWRTLRRVIVSVSRTSRTSLPAFSSALRLNTPSGESRDDEGISKLPQIQLSLPYKISCI